MESTTVRGRREFARIPVRIAARLKILEPSEAEELRRELLENPSVWSPPGEPALRELASGSRSDETALLSQAILDLCERLQVLDHRVAGAARPMEAVRLVQLSGSGAQLHSRRRIAPGTLLELQLDDDGSGVPPLRILAEVVHARGEGGSVYGVRFAAIHPIDSERLIRYVYRIQRQTLRKEADRETSDT
jgi:hypothetical protein